MEQLTLYAVAASRAAVAAAQEKLREKRVKSHCIAVPITTTTNLVGILSAMDKKLGKTQWRASHDIAAGEYIISTKNQDQVRTLVKEGLLVNGRKLEIRGFEGIAPINLRLVGLDASEEEEEVARVMQENLGATARVLSVRRVTRKYGDNHYQTSTAICKIEGNAENIPHGIKLGVSYIKVFRNDACFKCHTVGHIAKFCPLNESMNSSVRMTEREEGKRAGNEWLHKRVTVSEEGEQQQSEVEENEVVNTPTSPLGPKRTGKPVAVGEQGMDGYTHRKQSKFCDVIVDDLAVLTGQRLEPSAPRQVEELVPTNENEEQPTSVSSVENQENNNSEIVVQTDVMDCEDDDSYQQYDSTPEGSANELNENDMQQTPKMLRRKISSTRLRSDRSSQ